MKPLPFSHLMRWAIEEYRQDGRVFGVSKEHFYRYAGPPAPLGPAAGPHSQMAQNIVVAYVAGGRFMELKTVQQLDGAELAARIARPCINAEDEGYNVEWSSELIVAEALAEYIKAWLALHALAKEFGLAEKPDFTFNISVGYDLPGIQSAKVDDFIEGMKNATSVPAFIEGLAWLKEHIGLFTRFTLADAEAISPRICTGVTLSTLHGCPPEEIERIARYLLEEKGLNVYVKCNPTLLGYDFTRRLQDDLGYGYLSFGPHHFENDLQYADAVPMLRRLLDAAAGCGRVFGVKLTNTFPVNIRRAELPGDEMYLSGRALFPLSLNVAAKLAGDFAGSLPISYSGGADAGNIAALYAAGLRPITMATTLLKPGGYVRLNQLAGLLEPLLTAEQPPVDAAALSALAESVKREERYRKDYRPVSSRKTTSKLPLFDCFKSSCAEGGCPLGQRVPEYLSLIAAGDPAGALRMIWLDNPLPNVTGAICNHPCQGKCTRMDYDQPLSIRACKHLAALAGQMDVIAPPLKTSAKALVLGAGSAGLAAAAFLRRNGVAVTVLEHREKPFGMVEYLIPDFRIAGEDVAADFVRIKRLGVEFRFGEKVTKLPQGYDFVIVAVGAWREEPPIGRGALDFLAAPFGLGKRVAVIGGGDVAMDCARLALRMHGVEQVSIVYRRTREFMPAQPEELQLALSEGAELLELLAPFSHDGQTLLCERMRLGDYDASGRRGVMPCGERAELPIDTVISAIGAQVDSDFYAALGLELTANGLPRLNAAKESSIPGVYVAGDGKAGPATVAEAIAGAKAVSADILAKLGIEADFIMYHTPHTFSKEWRRGQLIPTQEGAEEAARCLDCGAYCAICVEVCPNRANVAVKLPGFKNSAQILHVDGLCNECGNCAVFCPHDGAPYRDKATLFWTEEDFAASSAPGFTPGGLLRGSDEPGLRALARAVRELYPWLWGGAPCIS